MYYVTRWCYKAQPAGHIRPTMGCRVAHDVQEKLEAL